MTIPVLCNQCGASLDVTESTRFATCRYCQTRLAIKHSNSAAYSEVLEELRDTTRQVAGDVELLKLQNVLEQIDREWLLERERYGIRSEDGSVSYPDGGDGQKVMSVIWAGIGICFAIFWLAMAGQGGAPGFFLLFGFFFLGLMIYKAVTGINNVSEYQVAREAYEARRAKILRQIEEFSPRNPAP